MWCEIDLDELWQVERVQNEIYLISAQIAITLNWPAVAATAEHHLLRHSIWSQNSNFERENPDGRCNICDIIIRINIR